MNLLAFDVGGANIKAARMEIQSGKAYLSATYTEYFPIWRMGKERLSSALEKVRDQISGGFNVNDLGVTMTAELSDVYFTKREGVNHILSCMEEVFPQIKPKVLDVDAGLIEVEEARGDPLRVAGANWAATAWMVGKIFRDCILIDAGSTTTDIIPIMNGRIASKGRTDLERLTSGELIYTGALRTNVTAILDKVSISGRLTRISSELFATSGDAHLILGNITEGEYTTETADGRGKSRVEALARLSRVVCADIEMLNEDEIISIVKQIWDKQLEQIAEGLRQMLENLKTVSQPYFPIVVTGIGRKFLAQKAAERIGFKNIIDLADIIGRSAANAATCVGLAYLMASRCGVNQVDWQR